MTPARPSNIARFLIACVCAYQALLRPFLIGSCKHYPTCSEYGIEALRLHGATRGSWLTIRRLIRCRPFSMGGFDPVPQSISPTHPIESLHIESRCAR